MCEGGVEEERPNAMASELTDSGINRYDWVDRYDKQRLLSTEPAPDRARGESD